MHTYKNISEVLLEYTNVPTDKTYAVHSIRFQTFFFVQAFKIIVDS